MNLFVENKSDKIFNEEYETILNKVILETLKYENLHENVEVSVLIVDEDEIMSINKLHRHINKITDVLSFPLIEPNDIDKAFKNNGKLVFLGDIIICFQKIINQAEDYGHTFERELAFLIAHSMLHLLGYDHIDAFEESIMFSKQDEILIEAGFPR